MVKVLGLGDNVCDVYLHTGTMYPGGQALNFSVYASQLGAKADYMGVFGQDAVAQHIQHTLDQKEIGRNHCRSYPGENGFARVTLVEGDRVFMGSNRGGVLQEHPIYFDQADLDYIAEFDLIHTTNNGFTDLLLPQMSSLRPFVSYDFSYRWNEADRVDRVCPYIDFAFLSCSDLDDTQTQDLCRRLHEKGCGVVTATRGSRGATVFDGTTFYRQLQDLEGEGKNTWSWEGFRASALPKALDKAAAFSSQTCLVHGAFGCGVPVPEELRARMYEGVETR